MLGNICNKISKVYLNKMVEHYLSGKIKMETLMIQLSLVIVNRNIFELYYYYNLRFMVRSFDESFRNVCLLIEEARGKAHKVKPFFRMSLFRFFKKTTYSTID